LALSARAKYPPALFWFEEFHLEEERDSQRGALSIQWLKEQARMGNANARQLLRDYGIPYEELKTREVEEPSRPIDMGIASIGVLEKAQA